VFDYLLKFFLFSYLAIISRLATLKKKQQRTTLKKLRNSAAIWHFSLPDFTNLAFFKWVWH